MNKATREGLYRLLVDPEREGGAASRVTPGPYTYDPLRSSVAGSESRTMGDLPVAPMMAESLLREFLDVMSALEADLAQRWITSEGRCPFPRAE